MDAVLSARGQAVNQDVIAQSSRSGLAMIVRALHPGYAA